MSNRKPDPRPNLCASMQDAVAAAYTAADMMEETTALDAAKLAECARILEAAGCRLRRNIALIESHDRT